MSLHPPNLTPWELPSCLPLQNTNLALQNTNSFEGLGQLSGLIQL